MVRKCIKIVWLVSMLTTFVFAVDDQLQTKQLDPDTTIMFDSNETENLNDFDPDVFVGEGNKEPALQDNLQTEVNNSIFDNSSIQIPNIQTLYIGMQYTNPSFGLSARFDLLNDFAMQAIVDFIGDINLYEGRGIFTFKKSKDYSIYAYGALGFWVYNYISDKNSYRSYNYRTSVGFGAGLGSTFQLRNFNPKLPPLTITTEFGFRMINLEHYNIPPIGFGIGVYYKF